MKLCLKKATLSLALLTSLLLPNAYAAQPGREFIILVDLSASRSPDVLAEDEKLVKDLILNLGYGDQFVLMQVQQLGMSDRPKRWDVTMPVAKDTGNPTGHEKQHLQSGQKSLIFEMPSFFQSKQDQKILHTDLFTTLNLAGETARDGGGKPLTILLLSDMLQSANGVEMEHAARMPAANFISKQKSIGLIPSLPGACVVVVGADPTTRDGVTVRKFWQSYFSAAQTTLKPENYRAIAPSDINGLCK